MKNGKARGLEGISVEMTKNASEKLHKIAPEQWGRGFKFPCTKKETAYILKITITAKLNRLY